MSIRHDRDLRYRKSRNRKKRQKTFKSEESAKAYAERMGYKEFRLINLRPDNSKVKKIRIEVSPQ